MLDNFVMQHVLPELEAAAEPAPAAATTAAAARNPAGAFGPYVPQHTIEGLMAAAALDAKV